MSKLKAVIKYQSVNYDKLNRKQQKKILLLIGVIIGLVIVLVVYGAHSQSSIGLDESSVRGGRDDVSQMEMLEQLQQVADDSRFRVKINENPGMDIETGATNVLVQNSVENNMNKKVIYYDDSGEIFYETYELYPGDDILSVIIPGDWNEGEYYLTAVIIAIDKELNEELIVTEMDIVLTVK